MDPTLDLTLIRDSFENTQIDIRALIPFEVVQQPRNIRTDIQKVRLTAMPNLEPIYVDLEMHNKNITLQNTFNNVDNIIYTKARNKANPFEKLGRGHFQNRAGIKIANIDAIFKLTGEQISYWQPIDFKKDTDRTLEGNSKVCFGVLAEGPGAFVEYLQYRWPMSIGYGITLGNPSSDNLGWDFRYINRCSDSNNRPGFKALYGDDNTGNLYTNAESFARDVKNEQVGCDLVTGDGGIDVSIDNNYYREEYLNSRLVLSQIYTSMLVLKKGGNLMLKIFNSVTKFTAQLLFITACCFEEFHIFKPVSSRPANAERYIVAKGYRDHSEDFINILKDAYHSYEGDQFTNQGKINENAVYLHQLFDINEFILNEDNKQIWQSFTGWLTRINNIHLQNQYTTSQKIREILDNGDYDTDNKYDLSKCFIIWNLPDNKQIDIKYK